ncbi:putative RNA-specific modification enzyme subunit [Oenococcus oeni]|uniref:RNA-specific modification enzyme subunit n=2 Tax=Oenococcus oeni TaxID=1247 RepID=A0AAQ2URC7_OENOE|nr:putative RNA-specific modification enzyme subunit [Oenococcus oeni]VDB97684.1 putative RNA-specific modification enzyme subunit [Oenococcus oeni]
MKKIMSKTESEITPIINRLEAMVKDQSGQEVQARNFDLYGLNLARVSFDRRTNIFTIKEFRDNHVFKFDNIDLVAIDIYEILRDLKLTF